MSSRTPTAFDASEFLAWMEGLEQGSQHFEGTEKMYIWHLALIVNDLSKKLLEQQTEYKEHLQEFHGEQS